MIKIEVKRITESKGKPVDPFLIVTIQSIDMEGRVNQNSWTFDDDKLQQANKFAKGLHEGVQFTRSQLNSLRSEIKTFDNLSL